MARGWKIEGETGTLAWQVYLTEREAAGARRFRIAYDSAASVLPDVSRLSLTINRKEVGRTGIAAPGDRAPVEFAVPANLLRAGFNHIGLSVNQRHRVDCSPEASYELWTRFDPVSSGLLVPRDSGAVGLSELAAIRPGPDGSVMIGVLFEGRLGPRRIDQIIAAASAVALAGRTTHPRVRFATDPETASSLNLLVGTRDEIAATLREAGEHPDVTGPAVLLTSPRSSAAPMLIATGRTEEEVLAAVEQLKAAAAAQVPATPADSMSDPREGLKILGGERIRLADLGIKAVEFSGRALRLPFEIEMPADFLAADYDRLSIHLAGATTAGLLSDARLQINLNGRDAASVPLSDPAGGSFRHNDVVVGLGALRPGRNTLEIGATLPMRSDVSCDSPRSLDEEAVRLLLLGESGIRFPRLARIARLPDLAQMMAGGFPYAAPEARPKLYVPAPDRESLSAAVTLAVRLSLAAGRSIPFSLVVGNPADDAGHALVVAAAPSLDPALMRRIGLDPEAVRRAWEKRDDAQADRRSPRAAPADATGDNDQRLDRPRIRADMLGRPSVTDRALDTVRSLQIGAATALTSAAGLIRTRLGRPEDPAIRQDAALIIAAGFRSPGSDDLITIVTAPDRDTLVRSVDAVVAPGPWSGPRGRLSVLDASGHMLSAADADETRLVPTHPLSVSNARLIAAGWLSLHPAVYVIGALLLAAVFGLAGHTLVKNVGRRQS